MGAQSPPEDLGQPVVELHLLAVDLPVLLLLNIARAPLIVGQESVSEVAGEVPLPDGGHHLAEEGVGLCLRVAAHRQEDVGRHQQDPCKNILCINSE